MHQTIFDNEEHIMDIKNIVEKYKYPDHNSVLQLYKYDKYISKYRDSSS